jgi:putative ABC transport system permease protein
LAERAQFYDAVREQVGSLPGVVSSGIVSNLFIGGIPEQSVTVEGDSRTAAGRLRYRSDEASPEFFRALGTSLVKGRNFSREDGPDSPKVAIINETMAHHLWPGREAVGKRFKAGLADSASPWFTVVGIVRDMRRQGLEREPAPQMFEALSQNPPRLATLLVRTAFDDPLQMAGPVQAAVRRIERYIPLYGVTSLESQLGGFLAQRRFQTSLLIGFSMVSLLIAIIGIYGLIQYSVTTRTHEIGIRVAVGASSDAIFRMVMAEGLALSLTGSALGLIAALWASRLTASLLFGVAANDPITYITVAVLLTATAAAACYLPARRAMRIEPMAALRHE